MRSRLFAWGELAFGSLTPSPRFTRSDGAVLGLSALAIAAGAIASTPRPTRAEETPATKPAPATRDGGAAEKLAAAIDAHVDQKLAKAKVDASPACDDAEFLRRASIDLVGSPPSPEEVMTFLADASPDKRAKKVDELLARPEANRHWAEVWTDIVEADARGIEGRKEARIRYGIRDWFQGQFEKDVPFDEVVRRLLTADGYLDDNGAVGYYLAYNLDAKNLTSSTARVFMGLQIECAQCHDHPFADWKREQFMGMAAFFARVRPLREVVMPAKDEKDAKDGKDAKDAKKEAKKEEAKKDPKKEIGKMPRFGVQEAERGELVLDEKNNPLTLEELRKLKDQAEKKDLRELMRKGAAALPGKRIVPPAFIVPAVAAPSDVSRSRREALGRMVTDGKNPYFKLAIANRVWTCLTGRPIVAYTEDLSDKDAAKDKELLAILAKGVGDLKYDLKELIRAIAKTKVYARSSRGKADGELESSYAKSVVRPIDGRPLARTLVSAMFLGERALEDGRKIQEEQLLVRFEQLFGETNLDPRKYEESIPQALKIMNGSPMAGTNRKGNPLPQMGPSPAAALGRLLSRFDDPRERVTRIYLSALCRPPSKVELDTALKFVDENGKGADVYEDLLWALVNSSEFRFNR